MTGALVGLAFGCGWVLMLSGWLRHRRDLLGKRVLPYVQELRHRSSHALSPTAKLLPRPSTIMVGVSHRLGELIGSSSSVQRRLVRLGSAPDVEAFRLRQAWWGGCGFGLSAAIGMSASIRGASVPVLLFACVLGFVGGVTFCDQRLSHAVKRRETHMRREFPALADLLALSVAAGESPVSALERAGRVSDGPLSHEFARVLGDIRSGTPVSSAFDLLASRTGVTIVARFAESMAVAIERGTPLIELLHAQAADVREASRRELIESGGRREITMMIPVVFLLLPLTIAFAFYPGFVNLSLTSGMP